MRTRKNEWEEALAVALAVALAAAQLLEGYVSNEPLEVTKRRLQLGKHHGHIGPLEDDDDDDDDGDGGGEPDDERTRRWTRRQQASTS